MIRLFGALLVTACGCWLGERRACGLRKRKQILEQIVENLEQLRRELEFRQTPLPELFERLEQMVSGPVRGLFSYQDDWETEKGMSAEWMDQVEALPFLTQEERYTLSSLGDILGRYPVREQGEAIGSVCTYLRQCTQQADREYSRMGKVYRGLGAACGGILVVLLL